MITAIQVRNEGGDLFKGYSWFPVRNMTSRCWLMIVIFSVLRAPQYPRPLALPSPLLAHQQPTLTGEQFEDCLDLFQLCLHALILNSLALHAEWSKL